MMLSDKACPFSMDLTIRADIKTMLATVVIAHPCFFLSFLPKIYTPLRTKPWMALARGVTLQRRFVFIIA
jgi:hypothetical protein